MTSPVSISPARLVLGWDNSDEDFPDLYVRALELR